MEETAPRRPRPAEAAAPSFATLIASQMFRRTLVSFLRPREFLRLRATNQQLAGELRLAFGPAALDGPPIHRDGVVAPNPRPVWTEGNTLVTDAFPDDPRFLNFLLLDSAEWGAWKLLRPDEADDERFRVQVVCLSIRDPDTTRNVRLFETGRAWAAVFPNDAEWRNPPCGTDAVRVGWNNNTISSLAPSQFSAYKEGTGTFTRPVALQVFDGCNAWHDIPGAAQWTTQLRIFRTDHINCDMRTFVQLRHVRAHTMVEIGAADKFRPPPNLCSFVLSSANSSNNLPWLAAAARDTPLLDELGEFRLSADTTTCDVPPRIKRLQLRIDSPMPLRADRIGNGFLGPGEFFIPPAVEALLIVCGAEYPPHTPLGLGALSSASGLRELVVINDNDCHLDIRGVPPCVTTLICPNVPGGFATLRSLRTLTLTAYAYSGLTSAVAAIRATVEELNVLGACDTLPTWPSLRIFRACHWKGEPLVRGAIPPALKVLDVHCRAARGPDALPRPFCTPDALPASLRVLCVTSDGDSALLPRLNPCPALVVMTVGAGFDAWAAVPPSVRVLVFTDAVPPSFWVSPVVAQLTGALVHRHNATSPPLLGDPIHIRPTPHMWWRRLTRQHRFPKDPAQMASGSFMPPIGTT